MMTDVAAPPAPGWYPDPTQAGQQRWWSGLGWTDHVQAPEPAPVPAPVVMPEVVPSAAGSVALSTPLPKSMTTEEQLAWHRPAEQTSVAQLAPVAPWRPTTPVYAQERGNYGYAEVAAPPLENPKAKASLILSLVSIPLDPFFVVGILGIVRGAQGLRRSREIELTGRGDSRRGMAQAGLVIGIISTVLHVASIPIALVQLLPHYDAAQIETTITQDLYKQLGQNVVVTCPASEPMTTGTTFECVINAPTGGHAYAEVTFSDSQGHYSVRYVATSEAITSTGTGSTS